MQALTFAGKRRVHVESLPDPTIEDPRDAIVAVRLAGICGSDLHVYHQRERGLDPGTAMGHEFVGEVIETGREVRRFCVGDAVCSPFTTSCGECFYCRTGLTSRCRRGQLFGWVQDGVGLHGAQAQHVRVPLADTTLVALPSEMSATRGLLLGDVLPTGYFAADLAGVSGGTTCAVVGCGPVGLMAVASARRRGCERIWAIDLRRERLDLAAAFGAEPLDASDDTAVGTIREATDGRGPEAVLEVVGSPDAFRLAYDLVRPGGVISSVGVHTEAFGISPAEAYDKNLTLRTGRCPARRYMDSLLPFALDQSVALEAVISHRLPLREGPRGYDIFDRKRERCTKVALEP